MPEIKPTLLRLRVSTAEALRQEVEYSSHRSMSALADDLLEKALREHIKSRNETALEEDVQRLAGSVC